MKAKEAKRAQQSEITAVYADRRGNICEAEGVRGMGRIGSSNLPLRSDDLIPLPESADLMFMPDHLAAGQGADGTEERIAGSPASPPSIRIKTRNGILPTTTERNSKNSCVAR